MVWASPISLATTLGITFVFFSCGYLDVSVPRVSSLSNSVLESSSNGLPHSEIHGSKPALGSPQLIAECYVLHRLSVPRHPRNALKTLDRLIRRGKPNAQRILLMLLFTHG